MSPSEAVDLARRVLDTDEVALLSRPRGVLHVYAGPLTPAGRSPRGGRPVCGRRTRRLHPAGAGPCLRSRPGARPGFARLCQPCRAWLSRRDPAAGTAITQHTAESVVWSVFAAKTDRELDACRHALLMHVPSDQVFTLVDLPAAAARRWGRPVLTAAKAIDAERELLRLRTTRARLAAPMGAAAI